MESEIKFKTIQFLNGVKYISNQQVEDLCYYILHNMNIEKKEDNFRIIKEACAVYFKIQIQINIQNK